MKRIALLTVALLAAASMAFAQYGTLEVYLDQNGTQCSGTFGTGFLDVYVLLLNNTAGAVTAFYQLVGNSAWTGIYFGESKNPAFTVQIGDSNAGVTFGFGDCFFSPLFITDVIYNFTTAPGTCATLTVGPHPLLHRGPGINDCTQPFGVEYLVPGGTLVLNPDGSCPTCGAPPNEASSWGKIKAIYQ